jgi:suppressor of fused-like protein
MTSSDHNANAPGWDAIDTALQPLYAGQTPKHYGTVISYKLGGSDPLQGISAYRRSGAHPHWHFVTYGFSELYDKESDDSDVSGYGFELTFRVADEACADEASESEPPMWAMNFLQNVARYVFSSGNVFNAGHYMNLNGPIALEHDTAIRSIAFVHDPELAMIDTPNGRVEFLQVVGITEDEEVACKRWVTLKALKTFALALPLYITDLNRGSLLADPLIAAEVEEGTVRDGSNTGFLFLERIVWTRHNRFLRAARYDIDIGAGQVPELTALLPARLPFGRQLLLVGNDARVVLAPGERCAVEADEQTLRVTLDTAASRELIETLKPIAGDYALRAFGGIVFRVHRTEIRDAEGNVIQLIG